MALTSGAMASELAKKMRIKAGQRMLALNAPEHYRSLIEPLPDGAELTDTAADDAFDVVHTFVANQAELERFGPVALRAAKPGALVWFSYPKVASKVETDITRDSGWGVLDREGWRGIFQISVDDTWSGLRFVQREG
jgi:hypothetical protein